MPSVPPAAQTARPRRKGERTAERILDAAESLFAERGYVGTTLRDVADRVGLRIPSLYNHFPNKDALYAAVLERGIGPVLDVLLEVVDGDSGPDTVRLIRRLMALLETRPNLARLVQHEILAGGQRLSPMLRAWIVPLFARANELVASGPGARRWSAEQAPLLVLAMYHVVVGYFTIAPLYKELTGTDLSTGDAIARQTELLVEMAQALLSDGSKEPPNTRS